MKLSPPWADQGWKVKIRDRERCETPHVSVIRKLRTWRVCLRGMTFLDAEPPPREVPGAVLEQIRSNLNRLVRAWNEIYPENPV